MTLHGLVEARLLNKGHLRVLDALHQGVPVISLPVRWRTTRVSSRGDKLDPVATLNQPLAERKFEFMSSRLLYDENTESNHPLRNVKVKGEAMPVGFLCVSPHELKALIQAKLVRQDIYGLNANESKMKGKKGWINFHGASAHRILLTNNPFWRKAVAAHFSKEE